MSLLLRWWSHPADYAWTAAYHRTNPVLRHAHIAIGTWCWLYAVLCVLVAHTPAGITTDFGRSFAYVLAGALTITGAGWMRTPSPSKTFSRVFVGFLEVSAAAALLLVEDRFVALAWAASFGVIGSYIATFHSPKVFLTHQGWAFAMVGALFVRAVTAPDADVVLACAYVVLLTLVLFSAPILTQALLLLLRRDAATAFYDPPTGLRNRRGLDAEIAEHHDTTSVPATSVMVMVIDLDDFKLANDRFGHAHGDLVLRSTANAIYAAFPPPAVTARTGGEESAILTYADPVEAIARAHALRNRFAAQAGVGATVSIGIADTGALPLSASFAQAFGRADAAMYAAKHAGGNTIYIHHDASMTPAEE